MLLSMSNNHIRSAAELAPDLGDRLAKSLRVSGVTVNEMASFLEVHRNTVGAWIGGRAHPNPANMRLWAMKTDVPYEWLRYGDGPQRAKGANGQVKARNSG